MPPLRLIYCMFPPLTAKPVLCDRCICLKESVAFGPSCLSNDHLHLFVPLISPIIQTSSIVLPCLCSRRSMAIVSSPPLPFRHFDRQAKAYRGGRGDFGGVPRVRHHRHKRERPFCSSSGKPPVVPLVILLQIVLCASQVVLPFRSNSEGGRAIERRVTILSCVVFLVLRLLRWLRGFARAVEGGRLPMMLQSRRIRKLHELSAV